MPNVMLPGVYSNQAPGATHMGYSQVPQQQPERGYGSVLTAPKGGDLTRVSPWLAAHATIASQIPITGYSGTYTSAETLSAIFKCIYSGSLPSQFPELHDQLSRYATVRLGLYADSSNAIPPVSIDEEDYLYGRNTNKNSTLLDRQRNGSCPCVGVTVRYPLFLFRMVFLTLSKMPTVLLITLLHSLTNGSRTIKMLTVWI